MQSKIWGGDYVNRLYRDLQTEILMRSILSRRRSWKICIRNKTPKEREDLICKAHGAVFIEKIGGVLKSGEKHDGRSPDYDDWELNGDIILWNDILERAFELSSMGIRVDAAAMDRQLTLAGADERRELSFQKAGAA